jgi:hypothetical protein
MNHQITQYRIRRKQFRSWGAWGLIGAGLIFLLFGTPFPTPFVIIPLIYLSIILAVVSVAIFLAGSMPPSTKLLTIIARETNAYITCGILIDRLGISATAAESVIKRHFVEGYLILMNKVTNETQLAQWITQFVGVGPDAAGIACPKTDDTGNSSPESQIDLGTLTSELPEMDVSDINNMILANTMHLGSSGQPTNGPQRGGRRRF